MKIFLLGNFIIENVLTWKKWIYGNSPHTSVFTCFTRLTGVYPQLVVLIAINRQELKDRHGDIINYHEVTHDGIPKYKFYVSFNIKLFYVKNLYLERNNNILMMKITVFMVYIFS